MKQCSQCGRRIRREEPDNAEFGTPVVDGRRYPDRCPNCGTAVPQP